MATPDRVELTCPNCGSEFRARSMGSSYFIAGLDTDLREKGSIEDVRRYSIATCPHCSYSDYTWEFLATEPLTAKAEVAAALGTDPSQPGPARNRPFGDFERLDLARKCFEARKLDRSALAELELLAYYVAEDLGRRDLVPDLRDQARERFAEALTQEDLPDPLAKRYAYLAGELARRGGRDDLAVGFLDQAIGIEDHPDADWDPEGRAWDIGRLAQRMRVRVLHRDDDAAGLLDLIRGEDPDVSNEACRLLATRRDAKSLEAIRAAWSEAGAPTRSSMLRELVIEPRPEFAALFLEALESQVPEVIRLGARGLGELGEPGHAEPLLAALERGVLSTEAALADALQRLPGEANLARIGEILARWEGQTADAAGVEESWFFTSDPAPLRTLLYTSGSPQGRELLLRDLHAVRENDLWDKVPSGGPVSAALALGAEIADEAKALLTSDNPAARRWGAYLVAELRAEGAADALAALVEDPDPVVRLQAASSLGRLGDTGHEQVVLDALSKLGKGDLPFALHFLVPFRSESVKTFLRELWASERAARSEILPLLGRQELDDELESQLSASLLETDDDTRAGAVTGLSFTGTPAAAERLRLLYDLEDSDEVLRRIVHGLGHLAREGHHAAQTVDFLRERLERATPRLRFPIALTLLQLGDPTGIDVVRERAALFHESYDRYDLAAPALKALADYERR